MRRILTLYCWVLLSSIYLNTVEAATRVRESPNSSPIEVVVSTTSMSSPTRNLNTGSLSDAILDVHLAAVYDVDGYPSNLANQNSNGNPAGRQMETMPAESPVVNLTAEEIRIHYPWIVEPEAISDAVDIDSNQPEPMNPSQNVPTNSRPSKGDGKTRFNNPRYLRDKLTGLNKDDYDFVVTQGVEASNGTYKVRLHQKWRRIPIFETSLVLEQESDSQMILESKDGVYLSGIEDDITSEVPTISREDAIQKALTHNRDSEESAENLSAELIVDTIGETAILAYIINYFVPEPLATAQQQETTTTTPTTTSSALQDCLRRCRQSSNKNRCKNACRAAHPTSVSPPTAEENPEESQQTSRRPWILINANTGVIHNSWNGLASVQQPHITMIRTGNPIISVQEYRAVVYKDTETQDCYYRKPIGGGKFLRVNDKNLMSSNGHKFTCTDANLEAYDATNGAASPRNTAYKWAGETINFFKRTGSINWKFDLYIETHHAGTRAVWNGRSVQLGDGDSYFYPMTTPDVVSHEIGHAYTEYNSNLIYNSQSGCINEAYSDMVASAFMDNFFKFTDDSSYLIGSFGVKFRIPHRNLCQPESTSLLFYDPKKPTIVSSLDYTPDTGLHNGSALYSKAFCLLSKTAGWDIQQAFKVFTNANAIYWTPKETFHSGACGVRKAAYDLKNTEQALTDVDLAFVAVDIACDESNV